MREGEGEGYGDYSGGRDIAAGVAKDGGIILIGIEFGIGLGFDGAVEMLFKG